MSSCSSTTTPSRSPTSSSGSSRRSRPQTSGPRQRSSYGRVGSRSTAWGSAPTARLPGSRGSAASPWPGRRPHRRCSRARRGRGCVQADGLGGRRGAGRGRLVLRRGPRPGAAPSRCRLAHGGRARGGGGTRRVGDGGTPLVVAALPGWLRSWVLRPPVRASSRTLRAADARDRVDRDRRRRRHLARPQRGEGPPGRLARRERCPSQAHAPVCRLRRIDRLR